jgi:hypothetical protein
MRDAIAICCWLCLLGISAAHAQQSPLVATGEVVTSNGQPAPGVPLKVEGSKGGTTVFTDANGKWSVYNLSPGTYLVKPAGEPAGGVPITVGERSTYKAPQITVAR